MKQREMGSKRAVGMEAFRDSLWIDVDMGTNSHRNEASPPLTDVAGPE